MSTNVWPIKAEEDEVFASKKSLKEEVANNPDNVLLMVTDVFGPDAGKVFDVQHIREGEVIYAVGPNAYHDRRWYATIERRNGKIVVK